LYEVDMAAVNWLVCKDCGLPFRQDEGELHSIVIGCGQASRAGTYADRPYD
jgi:hypothetical protein